MPQNQLIDPPFNDLTGQDRVAQFLTAVIRSDTPAHAYLFAGPLGSGKTEATGAFAQALLCEQGGGDACDTCLRVAHGTHPDFHVVPPLGAAGYLAEQIQEIIASAQRAPVRAHRKVYLLTRGDLLSGHAANALLKTLEEPPADTIFVLMARNRDAVLETIVSRCQVLPFRRIPEDEAIALVVEKTGVAPEDARIALAATGGSLIYAAQFMRSEERRNLRVATLEVLERLVHADDASVLDSAKLLIVKMRAPLDVVKMEQQRQLEQSRDFLSTGNLSRLETQLRRELTSRERETIGEILDVTSSWIRDIMVVQLPRSSERPVNVDALTNITKLAEQVSLAACVRALDAVREAERQIQYNVSVQLALEVMLFALREELTDTRGPAPRE
ncbi:MAG: DNA polymerase III subunit delta' [Coriobacteriales bacterium]|nr:DNA polymerase III subunit delta' [Coriobacteriales bacterium]